jgi:phospholipase C
MLQRVFVVLLIAVFLSARLATAWPDHTAGRPAQQPTTTTPVKYLVVIFDENISFDHYFGAYPVAANAAGEPPFFAAPDTPSVNNLTTTLLNHNPDLAASQAQFHQPFAGRSDFDYAIHRRQLATRADRRPVV